MPHACRRDKLDYSFPMKKMLWLTLLLVGVMLVGGCKSTSSGSREFVPGKGWIHTD
jgi:hypothetical protein